MRRNKTIILQYLHTYVKTSRLPDQQTTEKTRTNIFAKEQARAKLPICDHSVISWMKHAKAKVGKFNEPK